MVLPLFLQNRLDKENLALKLEKKKSEQVIIETKKIVKKKVNKKIESDTEEEDISDTEDTIKPSKIYKNLAKYLIKKK